MTDASANTELVMTRIFDAPRELVYQAFVDADQLVQWFGPVGFSVPRETVSIDARVGGHQRFTMVSDEDPAFSAPINATFTEVVENELLVGSEETEAGSMYLRVEFHDEGGKTRLVLKQGPYSPEIEAMAREGWNSSFAKLDALLVS
jgi:uncharacterized protein YndB with AHSA1/START domain